MRSSVHPPLASWGLDPLYKSYRKLLVSTILHDIEVVTKQLYFEFYLCNRPISRVEIVGTVVSKRVTRKKVILEVDDGSGCIELYQYFDESAPAPPHSLIELGSLVKANGSLEYRASDSSFAISIKLISSLTNSNMESHFKISAVYLYKTEYSVPFFYQGFKVPQFDKNPSLACTCRSMLLNTHHPSEGTSSSSSSIASRVSSFLTQDQVDRVRDELLLCRCNMKESSVDELGLFRLCLAHHLLTLNVSLNEGEQLCGAMIVQSEDVRRSTDLFHQFTRHQQHIDTYGPHTEVKMQSDETSDKQDTEFVSFIGSALSLLEEEGVVQLKGAQHLRLLTLQSVILPAVSAVLQASEGKLGPDALVSSDESYVNRIKDILPSNVPKWRIQESISLLRLQAYSVT